MDMSVFLHKPDLVLHMLMAKEGTCACEWKMVGVVSVTDNNAKAVAAGQIDPHMCAHARTHIYT